ncbi:premelanosome protein a [Notolabrus celidotus]|uniref:premelanosome protein a n=1 Tax=Notolabrus celidotus TaxID=1203425 RepID=UPI0014908951|nr:premelanosome protein a [Notolabrus celidotus]
MRTLVLGLLVATFAYSSAIGSKPKYQFTRYHSWNTRLYPLWKDGDQRYKNAWKGGDVTFDVKNDSPTLTGAKATFTINLNFPQNQTQLSNGQVVWARNCTVDGQNYTKGQLVYTDNDHGHDRTKVFPNGAAFHEGKDKKNRYVYVWKAWGRYWQVADGPSSSLSLNTRDTPLGSYNMEVVIYHCRSKDKFIPLGYASTVFTVTDQVPFTMSLTQVSDVNQEDQNFIQKKAIAFSVRIHDPSQYLNTADISFSWDFGDSSGTLISRELTVTHAYLDAGTFKPQVVLMATIPQTCGSPTVVAPIDSSAASEVVISPTVAAIPTAPAEEGDMAQDLPASDAPSLAASLLPPAAGQETEDAGDSAAVAVASVAPAVNAAVVPEEQDPAITVAPAAGADVAAVATVAAAAAGEVANAATAAPVEPAAITDAAEAIVDTVAVDPVAEGDVAVEVAAVVTVAPAVEGDLDDVEVAAAVTVVPAVEGDLDDVEVAAAVTVVPAVEGDLDDVEVAAVVTVAAIAPEQEATVAPEATVIDAAVEVVQDETEAPVEEIIVTVVTQATAVVEAVTANAEAEAAAAENVVAATAVAPTDPAQVALIVAKRDVADLIADCNVYRYGSIATSLDVVQAIESVEIVQMSGVLSLATTLDQNAVDVTVICQGSLPREVCTVISDADCVTPMETVCTEARPSPDCQMIIRSFFNDTGVFCINVSLTNDVSFAEASARVSVSLASTGSPAGTAVTVLGVMVLACVACCLALMYRRFKQYQPLREDSPYDNGGSSGVTSVPMLLWNLLSRQSAGESRPLLHGRIV